MKKLTVSFVAIILLICIMLPIHNASAQQQPSDTTFIKAIGGANVDYAESAQQTADGGYIVAGFTESYGAGERDVLLLKFDNAGDLEWARTAGGSFDDYAESVQQTVDGGYIVVGPTRSFGAGDSDILLLKYDSAGTLEWARTAGGSEGDHAYTVQQTTDGGYIVSGSSWSYVDPVGDILLLKFDSVGTLEWARTAGGDSDEWAPSVQQTTDGGYIVAGHTRSSFSAGYFDTILLKYDSSGALEWARTAGGSSAEQADSVKQTNDGGYIVTGYTESYGAGGKDVFVLKYDNAGTLEWARTVGGSTRDYGARVQQTADDGYIIAGDTDSYGAGNQDVFLLKFSDIGTLEWARTAGGSNLDCARALYQTDNGYYLVAGRTYSYGAGDYDALLLKTDSNGLIPGCNAISSASPSITSPNPTVGSPTLLIDAPTVSTDSPAVSLSSPSPTTEAICSVVNLAVPYYNQNDSDWCWASSLSMILRYYGYDRKPWQVAADWDHAKDQGLNLFLEFGGLEPWLETYYDRESSDAWDYKQFSYFNDLKECIQQVLSEKKPIWMGCRDIGHVVVVTGYTGVEPTDYVYLNDPYGSLINKYGGDQLINYPLTWQELENNITTEWGDIIFGEVFIIYAKTPALSVQPSMASIQVQPFQIRFSRQAGDDTRFLWFDWDGSSEYEAGYKYDPGLLNLEWYIPDADAQFPYYGYHATKDDVLYISPSYSNYSSEALYLRTKLEIRRSGNDTPLDNVPIVSGADWVYPYNWLEFPTNSMITIGLNDFEPGVYKLTLILEGNTDGSDNFIDEYDRVEFYFGVMEPPSETPTGSQVSVDLGIVEVTFDTVTGAGITSIATSQGNPGGSLPPDFPLRGQFVDVTTTATYTGPITVCLGYDPNTPNPENLRLFHWESGHWIDVTTSVDTINHRVCGQVTSLSWFFIGGQWVWVEEGVPAFPSVYAGIAAAFGAAILAFLVRRRLVHQ